MIEKYLAMLLLICVRGVYVYCMYRKGEIFWVLLGTGSAQIKVCIYRTVCTGALVTHYCKKNRKGELKSEPLKDCSVASSNICILF